jgi:hypothetical protein
VLCEHSISQSIQVSTTTEPELRNQRKRVSVTAVAGGWGNDGESAERTKERVLHEKEEGRIKMVFL